MGALCCRSDFHNFPSSLPSPVAWRIFNPENALICRLVFHMSGSLRVRGYCLLGMSEYKEWDGAPRHFWSEIVFLSDGLNGTGSVWTTLSRHTAVLQAAFKAVTLAEETGTSVREQHDSYFLRPFENDRVLLRQPSLDTRLCVMVLV